MRLITADDLWHEYALLEKEVHNSDIDKMLRITFSAKLNELGDYLNYSDLHSTAFCAATTQLLLELRTAISDSTVDLESSYRTLSFNTSRLKKKYFDPAQTGEAILS